MRVVKRTRVLATAAAAVAAVVIAGCGGGTEPNAQNAPSAPNNQTQQNAQGQASHNQADIAFAQGMIPHHQQAIDMSRTVIERGQSQEVKDLAKQIESAQGPEINTMTGWLQSWGVPESPGMEHGGGMQHDGGHMEGMMSPEQMQQFEQAQGAELDRMFLTMMIEHHEGAVTMAQNELDNGQYPEAKQLAQQIIDTQEAEIATMQGMLPPK